MIPYHLAPMKDFFYPNSIASLQPIFEKFNLPFVNDAEKAKLQAEFLSIVEREKSQKKALCYVSPNGLNFIFCVFEQGKCFLLNPRGATLLFQDRRIYEGELNISNVQWMEQDNIVIVDIYDIVSEELKKCICHFSNDWNQFVYFTEPQKISHKAFSQARDNQQRYFDETIWLCPKCSTANLMENHFCINCGAPCSW